MSTNSADARSGIRVGLLYPTRNCGEDDFVELARRLDPTIGVEFGYVPWGPNVDRLEDLDVAGKQAAVREIGEPERLLRAATRFTGIDVVSWACSSCSFVWGADGAREQARTLRSGLRVPASSTSLAFVAALEWLGIRRVALGSVYHEDMTSAFVDFLAEAGVTTVHRVSCDAPSDRALAAWTPRRVADLAAAADHDRAEAVLVPETALHTTTVLDELDRNRGKPVLTATQVTLWHALAELGVTRRQLGVGRLFGD